MAWTVTVTLDRTFMKGDGREISVIKYACTSDASGSGDKTLSTELNTTYGTQKGGEIFRGLIEGSEPIQLVYVDTDATENPTVTLDNSDAVNFHSKDFTAGTDAIDLCDATAASWPVIVDDVIFASTTLGNTKKATFYLYLVK